MLTNKQVIDKFEALSKPAQKQREECDRLRRYWKSGFVMPWMPAGVRLEYRQLVKHSRTNWLRLAVKVKAQRLTIDNIRTDVSSDTDAAAWRRWMANDMNARARRNNTTTMLYGLGVMAVWPTESGVVIREESPRFMYVEPDPDDLTVGVYARKAWEVNGTRFGQLIDDEVSWRLVRNDAGLWEVSGEPVGHELGQLPVVPFFNEPDSEGGYESEIEPLIPTQQRIHETILDRLVAQKYGSFRQRWATGMLDEDGDDDADEDGDDEQTSPPEQGVPASDLSELPFVAGIDRLWVASSDKVKFGEFSVTDLKPLLDSCESDIRQLASTAQVSVTHLYPGLSNISDDTFQATQDGMYSNLGEKQEYLDEPYAKLVRLAARADGDTEVADSALVTMKWRDPRTYSPAVIADSLTKLASIGVPLQFLLEKYGLSDQDITRVMELRRVELAEKAAAQAAAFGADLPDGA